MEKSQENTNNIRRKLLITMFSEMEKGYEDILKEIPEDYFARKEEILNSVDNKEMVYGLYTNYKNGKMTLSHVLFELMNKALEEKNLSKATRVKKVLDKVEQRSKQMKEEDKTQEQNVEEEQENRGEKGSTTEKEEETPETEEVKRRAILEKRLKSMFKQKEEQFEDLLIYSHEYKYFKRDMFELLDKDLNGLKSIMNEMRDMTLSDIYSKMLEAAQKLGQEQKAIYISKTLEKIKQREAEIKKEAEELNKKEEELRNYKNKDNKKNKDNSDKKNNKGEQPYEKTTIIVDAKRNKITIYLKGKTKPSYEVYNNENIAGFIKNGKEYKNMKQTIKYGEKEKKIRVFDRKAAKKADPAILGILVQEDMEAAREYVNSFKEGQKSLVDVKYAFSKETINVPGKALRNYKNYAKKAEKAGTAEIEGLTRGPIKRIMDWNNARKVKKIDAGKKDTIEAAKTEKEQETEAKNNFKDEMRKDAPSPEEQAEAAKKFEEKGKQKAQKRDRKEKKTKTAETVK